MTLKFISAVFPEEVPIASPKFRPDSIHRMGQAADNIVMGRHRSSSFDNEFVQLLGLMVLGCSFSAFFRGLMLGLVVLVTVVLTVYVMCRWFIRSSQAHEVRFGEPPSQRSVTPDQSLQTSNRFQAQQIDQQDGKVVNASIHSALRSMDWFQFERLMAVIYEQQGYTVQRLGGAKPDGGVDLILSNGAVRTAVQCKHWKSWTVGVPQIREFLGALTDSGIQDGIFITIKDYTPEARTLAAKHNIQLCGEPELRTMLEGVQWKWNPSILAVLNDKRKICPRCESEMVLRTSRGGRSAGKQFWGCSKFPRCRGTMQLT